MRDRLRRPFLFLVIATMLSSAGASRVRADFYTYCDYYWQCWGWDGDYCYDDDVYYMCEEFEYNPGPGEEKGSENPGGEVQVTVEVTTADVRNNSITVVTSPSDFSGRLEVAAVKQDSSLVVISDEERSGGTYNLSWEHLLPEADYTAVVASWYPLNRQDAHASRAVRFRVLGDYRHSQYNTPSESACGGAHVDRTIAPSAANCSGAFQADLRYNFTTQVDINGTGRAIDEGLISISWTCSSTSEYTQIDEILGPGGRPVNGNTVAHKTNHPHLTYGDEVKLVGANAVKTVTDSCPGCSHTQLDNYNATTSACSGSGVGDLGNFKTIRINR